MLSAPHDRISSLPVSSPQSQAASCAPGPPWPRLPRLHRAQSDLLTSDLLTTMYLVSLWALVGRGLALGTDRRWQGRGEGPLLAPAPAPP